MINLVFRRSGPDLVFVEIENNKGESIRIGEWVHRDGMSILKIEEDACGLKRDSARYADTYPEACGLKASVEHYKNSYLSACGIVARMHEAAVGGIKPPIRGVIEDVEDLRVECEGGYATTEKLSNLLKGCANALKGDPGPLTQHSWHDLPEVAKVLVEQNEALVRENKALRDKDRQMFPFPEARLEDDPEG